MNRPNKKAQIISDKKNLPDNILTEHSYPPNTDIAWWRTQLSERARMYNYPEDDGDPVLRAIYTPGYYPALVEPITVGYARHLEYRAKSIREAFPRDRDAAQKEFNAIKTIQACVGVNLYASDKALVRSFLKCVHELREQKSILPATKPVTERKIKKLEEYKVLSVLDLLIWEKKENTRIKRSLFADMIFNYSKGERELVDTIIPFSKEAIRPMFLEEMSSLEDS